MIPDDAQTQLEIRCRQAVEELLAGEYLSVFKGRGIEFEDVRPYEPGDEVRSMDWKVTARTGEPHVKRFIEERDLTVYLLLDLSASAQFGSQSATKFDACVELAALIGYSAIANHDRVGLILFAESVEHHLPPAKGLLHLSRLLYEARHHQPLSTGTRLAAPLDFLLHVAKKRAVVFLLSDFLDPGFQEPLQIAAARHDVIAISIVDRRENHLVPGSLLRVRDAETGTLTWLDAGDPRFRHDFAAASAGEMRQRTARIEEAGVDHFELVVGSDYAGALHAFLQARLQAR